MEEKKYWQSLEELNTKNTAVEDKEFAEELPVLGSILEPISTASTGRRDFLKMVGFSMGAATIAAGCQTPVRKSIPYVFKPDEITPGVPNYYASAYTQGGDFVSVLVKTREGRPIKIEGNADSIISRGGTTAIAQASVVSLYDGTRYKFPLASGKQTSWKEVDTQIATKLAAIAQGGGKIALLSSTIISPSTKSVIEDFKSKYPTAYHVTFDAVSYSGMLLANEATFGKKALPDYKFDEADLIVGVGCDFLGTWINPTKYAAAYAVNRKVSSENPNMSRHIQIESVPTTTSSTADLRVPVSPSEEALAIADIYNVLNGGTATIKGVTEVAKELLSAKAAGKKTLVVCGVNDTHVQTVVNAINNFLGNYGTTISWERTANYKQGTDAEVQTLVQEMKSGAVKALLVLDSNPSYALPNAKEFNEALKKIELSVSFSEKLNETSDLCQYVCPTHHYLESWNDAEPETGIYATIQPTIAPLFDTRQYQESLLTWAGNTTSFYDYIRTKWQAVNAKQNHYVGFDAMWDNTLSKGELVTASGGSAAFNGGSVSAAAASIASTYKKAAMEVKFYQSVQGDGTLTDNPFIQELPDPISKVTWDNYIVANPKWVEEKGLTPDLTKKEFSVGKFVINGVEYKFPIFPLPGVAYGTFGVKVGYGRTKVHAELNRGVNVYPALALLNNNFSTVNKIDFKGAEGTAVLAVTQTHFTIKHQGLGGEKVRYVVKETTLEEYKKDNAAGNQIGGTPRKEWIEHHLKTLYGAPEMPGHQWGMVVDLNTCTGCSACVISCNIENNVPVVGQDEVRRAHEMHWLRIDRYYTGDVENPEVVFQPLMCQHCDNAPCENVCPVNATNHSSDGINQMAYNRCIGTRYCANNCPYKVRRFNWFDYAGSDSFNPDNTFVDNYDDKLGLLEPLSRMVLNPDVMTRSRGVIEKCSFCYQRVQAAKGEARKAGEPLKDGAVKTACQTACPTNAITFGDVNNKDSKVHKLTQDDRAFGVIEEIHTLPSVSYLVKVRNKKPIQA